MEKVTIATLMEKKLKRQPITFLTGYDYPMAQMEEKAEIDIILVGDSIGMTVFGYDSTLPVTMDIMISHAAAVRRGAPNVFLIGDMPYMSYQVSIEEAIRNAGRFMAECGCDAVKLEGGREVFDVVKAIVKATIPVMGHLGLTPQSIAMLGGFKAQGRDARTALRIIEDAQALEEAGISLLLLEAVPHGEGQNSRHWHRGGTSCRWTVSHRSRPSGDVRGIHAQVREEVCKYRGTDRQGPEGFQRRCGKRRISRA
jgi:3-methyl-2-oxobutanoate hydroxymethyltransferase